MRGVNLSMRKSGITLMEDLAWGTHFGLFYQSKEDLLDVLVPYFATGLGNHELCVWVVESPLSLAEAREALKNAVGDFEAYEKNRQIRFVSQRARRPDAGAAEESVIAYINEALAGGFDGLRFAGHAQPEEPGGKRGTCHGTEAIGADNAIGIFAYPRDEFDAMSLMDVLNKHSLALVRNAGKWELIEGSEARVVKDALKRTEQKLHSVFSNMSEGFAYHRILVDADGEPCDYIFLEANEAFERLTGLRAREIIGKRVTDVLPGIEKDPANWIKRYGRVALTGEPVCFESYSESLKKWYSVSAFSPRKGFFVALFSDVTDQKESVEQLAAMNEELAASNEELRVETENRAQLEGELRTINDELEARVRLRSQQVVNERQRLYDVMETLPAMVCLLTPDYHVTFANRSFRDRFGESRGRRCYEYCFDRSEPCEFCETYKVLETGRPHRWELTTPNMSVIDAHDFPFVDTDGSLGVLKMYIDVTRQKRAEAELKKHREQLEVLVEERTAELYAANEQLQAQAEELTAQTEELRSANEKLLHREQALTQAKERWERTFDSVPDLIAILDDKHRIVQVNGAMAERLGVTPEQCIGWPCYEVVHGTDAPPMSCPHILTMHDGGTHMVEVHEDRLGADFLVSTTALYDERGKMIGSVHVARDVTRRKQMETALRENETRLRLALDAACLTSFEWDIQRNQVRRFMSTEPALAPTPAETPGTFEDVRGAVHPEDREVFTANVQAALEREDGEYTNEFRVVRPDGSVAWLSERGRVERDAEGLPVRLMGLFQDITDRKEIEESIKWAARRDELLSETAARLLESDDPQGIVEDICGKVMDFLDCHAFFNYLADEPAGRLRLNACVGIDETEARKIEWLDYGTAVCGRVARDRQRIIVENIQHTADPRTDLVKSCGIQAYCCHPLIIGGRLIGTLSFGTRSRVRFSPEDIEVMKAVTDLVAIAMDRIETERALRANEAQLRTMIESLDEGLVVADLNGNLFHWNPAAIAMHGFADEEECRHQLAHFAEIFELSTEEDGVLPLEKWPLARILRGETLHAWDIYIRRLNSDWQRVLSYGGSLARDEQGKPLLAVVTVSDITERRKTEQIVRDSQQRLARSQEIAHLGSWELDLVKDELTWSDEVYRIFGLQPQEFGATYEAFLERVHPNDRTAVDEAYSGSIRDGRESYEIEHRVVRADNGEIRFVHEKCEHFRDADGNIIRSVGMVHDVTERKQAEHQLQRTNENLEQFAYVASHDLQEPLRIMASYSQLLEKRYKEKLDQDAKDFIGYIVDAAVRMQTLITDLLTYSRAGRRDLTISQVDCNEVVRKVTASLSKSIEAVGAALICEELPVVSGQEVSFIQLFQNLIGNALKFHSSKPPEIKISACRQCNEWIFSVRDNGIGIEPQYAEKIFQVFQRLHSRNEYEGTGIGLSICRKIVENWDGRIWVESEPDQGSVFYFTIPHERKQNDRQP